MRTNSSDGFTLLEVMMATVLLAVGGVSIVMVLTSAAAYATRRAEVTRVTQVLEEARSFAQAQVNNFDRKKAKEAGRATPGDEKGMVALAESQLYANYGYDLQYRLLDPTSPEMGFDTLVTIHVGETTVRSESMVVVSNVIPMDEFATSFTYEEDRNGEDDTAVKETR
jgi:prepilin-type N-terminal cleavage/methylation domain-containing protein